MRLVIRRALRKARAKVPDKHADAFSAKVATLRREGYPEDQALAIAYRTLREDPGKLSKAGETPEQEERMGNLRLVVRRTRTYAGGDAEQQDRNQAALEDADAPASLHRLIPVLPLSKGPRHWITVRPNGPGTKGRPMLVEGGEGGAHTVVAGAGGKLKGKVLKNVKSKSTAVGEEGKGAEEGKETRPPSPKKKPTQRRKPLPKLELWGGPKRPIQRYGESLIEAIARTHREHAARGPRATRTRAHVLKRLRAHDREQRDKHKNNPRALAVHDRMMEDAQREARGRTSVGQWGHHHRRIDPVVGLLGHGRASRHQTLIDRAHQADLDEHTHGKQSILLNSSQAAHLRGLLREQHKPDADPFIEDATVGAGYRPGERNNEFHLPANRVGAAADSAEFHAELEGVDNPRAARLWSEIAEKLRSVGGTAAKQADKREGKLSKAVPVGRDRTRWALASVSTLPMAKAVGALASDDAVRVAPPLHAWSDHGYRFEFRQTLPRVGVLTVEGPTLPMPFHVVCPGLADARQKAPDLVKQLSAGVVPAYGVYRRMTVPPARVGAAQGGQRISA